MRQTLFFSLFFVLLCIGTHNAYASKEYQFNLNFGVDYPSDTDDRGSSASFARFALSTEPAFIRFVAAFTFLTGGGLQQGDFSAGIHFYPLISVLTKSPIQPYFFSEGVFGVGKYDGEVRMDTGYELGSGVDLRLFKKSGFTLGISQHKAEEDALRIFVGYYLFR